MLLATLLACRVWAPADDRDTLVVWRHESAGPEMAAGRAMVASFEARHPEIRVDLQSLPQGSYTESITAAALADQLPCVIDVDQPLVPNFAWTGHLTALDDLDEALVGPLSAGARGTYRGELYSVGQFDIVVALFARRSELQARGVRIATMAQPYSHDELLGILRDLKASDSDRFPIDINTVHKGEWASYGFGPWLVSAGGDWIDRDTYQRAEGVLNGPASLVAMRWLETLVDEALTERNAVDDQAFLQGRTTFHFTGSWSAAAYEAAFGDDLLVMPPPDFGTGPRIGSGSWQWSIARNCASPEAARAFVEHLITPEAMAELSRQTGFVPVSEAAAALTERYAEAGRWRGFFDFAQAYAVARPETPGYPTLSASFERALLAIRAGADAQDALDDAVDDIEYDIVRNRGYGFAERR
ncbi:MAG: extracellular solute-binding protein [Myxococcota bacterium]